MRDPHDIDLMQHADGELDGSPDDARAVDGRLATDPIAAAKVATLGEVGELVRGHLELAADAVPEPRFAAMWREIDKQLDLAAAQPAAPVAASTPVAAASAAPTRGGLLAWLDRKLGYIVTGVASAGAVAIVAFILYPTTGGDSSSAAPIEPMPVVHRPGQIEYLDTPGGTPTVLQLQDKDGDTTVIWVTPDDIEGT